MWLVVTHVMDDLIQFEFHFISFVICLWLLPIYEHSDVQDSNLLYRSLSLLVGNAECSYMGPRLSEVSCHCSPELATLLWPESLGIEPNSRPTKPRQTSRNRTCTSFDGLPSSQRAGHNSCSWPTSATPNRVPRKTPDRATTPIFPPESNRCFSSVVRVSAASGFRRLAIHAAAEMMAPLTRGNHPSSFRSVICLVA